MPDLQTDVAIIGGGLAGLVAARLLQQRGIDFVLLEARDRLGGRILSVDKDCAQTDDGFDLGPSWFWPGMQPRLAALVRDLNLATFPQHLDGDLVVERRRGEPLQRYPAFGQDPPSMRIAGGTAALVRALAQSIPVERVYLNTPVTRAVIDHGGPTLVSDQGAAVRSRGLILAAPPRVLAEGLSFDPPLDPGTASSWRQTPTWMAPHAKFFALYEQPFWRDAGLSGAAQSMLGPMVDIHDATSASGKAALFGFLGLDADERRSIGEAALTSACVAQLGRLFGPPALSPTATLFKDWSMDPLTATAADRLATGHPMPGQHRRIPGGWSRWISMAGSETSDIAPGFLAGAVQAATRACAEREAALRATPGRAAVLTSEVYP